MKIVKKIQLKIVTFTAMKNRCMLHGRVFIMWYCFKVCCLMLYYLWFSSSRFNCLICVALEFQRWSTVGLGNLLNKSPTLLHTCDTFLSPSRDIWNFWSGNSCLISGGFHVANFGFFYQSLKVTKSSDIC